MRVQRTVDPEMERSLRFCQALALVRVMVLIPMITLALLAAYVEPTRPAAVSSDPPASRVAGGSSYRGAHPESAWTEEFELRPLAGAQLESSGIGGRNENLELSGD